MDTEDNKTVHNRDKSIDCLKFSLIILVIFGHCLEKFGLHKRPIIEHIYQFIYLFHMPIFVYLSGYFMNKMKPVRSFFTSLLQIFETYIFFQLLSYILSCINGIQNPLMILNPAWAMWYLPSLIFWRLTIYILPRNIDKHKYLVFLTSIIASVACGFVNYKEFAFQRFFTFFPFFIIGYYSRHYYVLNKIKEIPVMFSFITIIFSFFLLFSCDVKTSVILYQSNSYFTQPISVEFGVLYRLIWYAVTILISIMMLPILHKINNRKLEYYGKFTLLFYVCHLLFLSILFKIYSYMGVRCYSLLSILSFVIIVMLLCLISKSKYCKYITNPFSTIYRNRRN